MYNYLVNLLFKATWLQRLLGFCIPIEVVVRYGGLNKHFFKKPVI